MSTDYCLEKQVLMQDLFDGRLRQYNVVETTIPYRLSERQRVLVDGRGNHLWVFANYDGYVRILVRYGSQDADAILEAISVAFNTAIYSEHEPQFRGFGTQKEWDEWVQAVSCAHRNEFYEDVVNFVTGKEHGLTPGTIGMIEGEIAKSLVLQNADLVLPQNKDTFLRIIEERYRQGNRPVTTTLDDKDIAFLRMIHVDVKDLPRT